MKNLNENALLQEMNESEMANVNGGFLVEALIITAILLLYSQEAH